MSVDAAARDLQVARLIYPLYRALIDRFELEMFPCRDLEQEPSTDPEALTRIRLWFSEAEKHIEVAHIRQYLQDNSVQEIVVRALLFRHLQKQEKTDSDRYKVDFLLGHYLAQNMPPDVLSQGNVKLSQVGQILVPVLGDHSYLAFVEELEGCIRDLQSCEHLQDLVDREILEKGKHLKSEAGARYFHQAGMIAFTRFNFLMRRFLIKLLAIDLDDVGQAVSELQTRGVETVDCSSASLGATESPASLRERIKQWRKPFQGKYSDIAWLQQISNLRVLLKSKLEQQPATPKPAPAAAAAMAASAPAQVKPAASPAQPAQPATVAPPPPTKPAMPATPATAVAAAASAATSAAPAAAKPAEKTPPPSPKLAVTSPKPAQKPFSVLLRKRWSALYPAIESLIGRLRTQMVGLWERVREVLSERTETPARVPTAATPHRTASTAGATQSKTPSGIIQPSAQVRDAIKRVGEQAATLTADADATVTVNEITLSLSAREVNAFRRPHDNLSGILQRSVAVRLIVLQALKQSSNSGGANLNATLKFAYSELAMLQDRVTHARTNKDVDGAMLLSNCQRSLQSLIDQVEGSLSPAGSSPR